VKKGNTDIKSECHEKSCEKVGSGSQFRRTMLKQNRGKIDLVLLLWKWRSTWKMEEEKDRRIQGGDCITNTYHGVLSFALFRDNNAKGCQRILLPLIEWIG
jgi:hypothetical protein